MKRIILAAILALFSLGYFVKFSVLAKEKQEDKGPLTKITFIHYKKGYGKPPGVNNGKVTCYDFLAKGARWKTTEGYEINPTNQDGLHEDFILNALTLGVNEWDSQVAFQVFGTGMINPGAIYQTDFPDEHNVAVFGVYPDSNVIAITSIWGYFGGPPPTRELIEWDMLFNDSFVWGDAEQNPSLMDLQNIATHELGHSAGMDDLYNTSCSVETMYGYSTEGETIKRNLNTGDIKGIRTLY